MLFNSFYGFTIHTHLYAGRRSHKYEMKPHFLSVTAGKPALRMIGKHYFTVCKFMGHERLCNVSKDYPNYKALWFYLLRFR